jgi:hypothetical protein
MNKLKRWLWQIHNDLEGWWLSPVPSCTPNIHLKTSGNLSYDTLTQLRFEPCTSQQQPNNLILHHPHWYLLPLGIGCLSFLEPAYLGNGVESISDMGLATGHILLPTTMRKSWQWPSTDRTYGLIWDSRQVHPAIFRIPPIFTFDRGADINLRPGKVSAWRSDRGSNSRLPERQSSVGTKEHQVPSYTDLQT